ncbi:ATP-binding cassette domain-containing protein [Lactobacillus sp. ESL0681]|uniref:ABC transporter ATP-binding protein n=1 Tax=Lactobacillus sp. ESL0681 TaxID=2983211 RepID=UPI0023F827C7|nr:ATP-binding cassette domain-containing protein [Lactobacillus sp. ESL0681]WEV40993.1 ATP-binding cassette domain-containing protein [Lactobacillus sp. ESL0681]
MLIEMENLTRFYQKKQSASLWKHHSQKIAAVQNISLKLNSGERIGLVGLNGSGKSTLIKLILGILQPSQGKISTFGLDPVKNRQRNALKIGIVFGQRSQLRWDLPASDTFKLNQEIYQISEEKFQEQLTLLTTLLDAKEIVNQPVRTLSLGQRMKAEFIAALIHDPELIILDEPTIGLDIISKKRIIQFLNGLKKKTIIFTSHDLTEVESVCNRAIILNHGKVIVDKSMQEIRQLDLPVTIKFTCADPKLDLPNLVRLPSGEYEISAVKRSNVSHLLKQITDNYAVEQVTIENRKLEYLLEQTNFQAGAADEN